MGNKLYEIIFFDLYTKKLELMKQNHLLKIGLVIFSIRFQPHQAVTQLTSICVKGKCSCPHPVSTNKS